MDEQERELAVADILSILFRGKWLILSLAIVFASILYIRAEYFTVDRYVSSGVLYVSNKYNMGSNITNTDTIQMGDIETSRTLSTTYMEILKTDSFLEDVSSHCSYGTPWQRIKGLFNQSDRAIENIRNINRSHRGI